MFSGDNRHCTLGFRHSKLVLSEVRSSFVSGQIPEIKISVTEVLILVLLYRILHYYYKYVWEVLVTGTNSAQIPGEEGGGIEKSIFRNRLKKKHNAPRFIVQPTAAMV